MQNVSLFANVESATEYDTNQIVDALACFPPRLVRAAKNAGIRIVMLAKGEKYESKSPELRKLGIDVDAWPVAPAGLFVVCERAVIIKTATPMTIAHEYSHAIDCALGGGTYYSGSAPAIRRAYATARSFVTPYAASGLDEYFAECLRAYVGVNNRDCPQPAIYPDTLLKKDPTMYCILDNLAKTA